MPRYTVTCTDRQTRKPYAVPIEARSAAEAIAKVGSAGHVADQAELVRGAASTPAAEASPVSADTKALLESNARLLAELKAQKQPAFRLRNVIIVLAIVVIAYFAWALYQRHVREQAVIDHMLREMTR